MELAYGAFLQATHEAKGREQGERLFIRRLKSLELELLRLLPRVGGVTEVTVRSGLEVLGLLETQVLDDDSGSEVKVVSDNLDEIGVGLSTGSVRVDKD